MPHVVLVVGAGASKPYNLPIGSELRDLICERLSENDASHHLIRQVGFSASEIETFRYRLSRYGSPSVDSFLARNMQFADIGKASIAVCLLDPERDAPLWPPMPCKDHWLSALVNAAKFDEQSDLGLTLLSFNYDRLVEQFVSGCLATRLGESVAPSILKSRLRVIHLHGTLGHGVASHGNHIRLAEVRAAMSHLKVVPEVQDDDADFVTARNLLQQADAIGILGFGFGGDNVRRLGLGDPQLHMKPVVATNKGFDKEDWKVNGFSLRDGIGEALLNTKPASSLSTCVTKCIQQARLLVGRSRRDAATS